MYKYKIGFHSYEESGYTELEHEKQFTEAELLDVIATATVETIKLLKTTENYYTCGFEDVYRGNYNGISLIDTLINKFEFKAIPYERTFSVFGWPSVFHKDSWQSDRSDDLNYITDRVMQAGFTKDDDSFEKSQKESEEEYLKEHPDAAL